MQPNERRTTAHNAARCKADCSHLQTCCGFGAIRCLVPCRWWSPRCRNSYAKFGSNRIFESHGLSTHWNPRPATQLALWFTTGEPAPSSSPDWPSDRKREKPTDHSVGLLRCSGGGARTHDKRINSPLLCQLSYPGRHKPWARLSARDQATTPIFERSTRLRETRAAAGSAGGGEASRASSLRSAEFVRA